MFRINPKYSNLKKRTTEFASLVLCVFKITNDVIVALLLNDDDFRQYLYYSIFAINFFFYYFYSLIMNKSRNIRSFQLIIRGIKNYDI